MTRDRASSVYSNLLESITSGKYPPGSRLPSENQLKEEYGVSRNTLRLAISRLNSLGILETRRGAGTYVRRQSVDYLLGAAMPVFTLRDYDLPSILEFRKGLEVEEVRLAAERATPDDLRTLRRTLNQMRQNQNNMVAFAAADTNMHRQLAIASHNEFFSSIMDVVQNILTNDMQSLLVHQGTDIDSLFYHEMIISCIEKKKSEEAAFLMSQHLNAVISRIQKCSVES